MEETKHLTIAVSTAVEGSGFGRLAVTERTWRKLGHQQDRGPWTACNLARGCAYTNAAKLNKLKQRSMDEWTKTPPQWWQRQTSVINTRPAWRPAYTVDLHGQMYIIVFSASLPSLVQQLIDDQSIMIKTGMNQCDSSVSVSSAKMI